MIGDSLAPVGGASPLPSRWRGRWILLLTVLPMVLSVGCGASGDASLRLAEAEREAVRAVDEAYVAGWEANDSAAVMATLSPDAVILPDGMEPIHGDSAIRAFWWPSNGSETRVISYETSVEEVGGAGSVAYVRGRGALAFDWRQAPGEEWQSFTSRSTWLALLRRHEDGSWRMTHRMWHPVEEN